MYDIGERIKTLRRERGMTQERLAARLGVSGQAVSKWENRLTAPDISLLSVIAGNLVASGIITLLSVFLSAYVDWIILVISLLAVLVVIVLIIKIILHKPTPPTDTDGETPGANE